MIVILNLSECIRVRLLIYTIYMRCIYIKVPAVGYSGIQASQVLKLSCGCALVQMEYNDAKAEWEQKQFELEQRLLEFEAGHFGGSVTAEDHAAMQQVRREAEGAGERWMRRYGGGKVGVNCPADWW